jgi:hypothetical protein
MIANQDDLQNACDSKSDNSQLADLPCPENPPAFACFRAESYIHFAGRSPLFWREVMAQTSTVTQAWPPEVDMIISSLEAASGSHDNRRKISRMRYRVIATLQLFSDEGDGKPWMLYTRDVNSRGIGFVSDQRVPLGHGGVVELAAPGGDLVTANCTVFRCREISPGWFEGAVYFNREQWVFAAR